jgi:acyl-CoA thioesterase II
VAELTGLPAALTLERVTESTYRFPVDPQKADLARALYGGQMLAQMIMAAGQGLEKPVESIHVVFARAGSYAEPTDYDVDAMSSGRTFASSTVTCRQGDRLLARGLVLFSASEPDLIRHQAEAAPPVSPPERGEPDGRIFPGSEAAAAGDGGQPGQVRLWIRHPRPLDAPLVNQAVLAWATDGFLISAALGPHPDLDESQAHQTLSTGVMSHTINFHRPVDASSWLLMVNDNIFAGGGRAFGTSRVFGADGELVASYSQDAMIRPSHDRGAL